MNQALPRRGYPLPSVWTKALHITPTGAPKIRRLALAAALGCSTLTGCGAHAAAATRDVAHEGELPALLELVADGSDVALRVELDAIARSPYFELVVASLGRSTDPAARVESEWLLDVARRTSHLVAAGWLAPDEKLETLVLLRGRYGDEDVQRMTAGESTLREERRPGVRAFVHGDRALAFVGTHTIVLGHTRWLRAAIARLDEAPARASEDDAAAFLYAMERRSASEVMVFVRVTDRVARLLAEMAEARGTGELRSLSLDADLESGLRMRFELATESAAAASRLLPIVVDRAAAIGETALMEVLGLGPSLRGARAESVGNSVVARAFVDDETLRAAISAARELAFELARPSP